MGTSDAEATGATLLAEGTIETDGAGVGEVAGGVDDGHAIIADETIKTLMTPAARIGSAYLVQFLIAHFSF